MDNREISPAVIRRLPRYYRYLGDLLEKGITRISSLELSEKMSVTASQIRQDFNNFGNFGQQGYGYNVDVLQNEIKKILGLDKKYNLIVLGSGNLGQALLQYESFRKRGFIFTALFDNSPALVGQSVNGLVISDISELEQYLQDHKVDIAVFCVPNEEAGKLLETVAHGGVKAIWSFSRIDVKKAEELGV
ncbi:MAG: redox-sensing transcriptional repressor Rex, partial [Clostridiales bacterium]|nr:redox-sensing transcriptional repressor Rex [Clostridiales bacterium]